MQESLDTLYDQAKIAVEDIVRFDQMDKTTKLFSDALEKAIAENNLQTLNIKLFEDFKSLIMVTNWVRLPLLKEDEVFNLFKYYFHLPFHYPDYDLTGKFKIYLSGYALLEDRNRVKNEVKSIIEKNKNIMIREKLNINFSSTENWLKLYISNFNNKPADPLKLQNFYTSSEDFKKLEMTSKEIIKKLFEFYQFLMYPSDTAKGFEGDIVIQSGDFLTAVKNGVVLNSGDLSKTKLKKILDIASEIVNGTINKNNINNPENEKKLKELQEIAEQFAPNTLERRAVEEEIRKLN